MVTLRLCTPHYIDKVKDIAHFIYPITIDSNRQPNNNTIHKKWIFEIFAYLFPINFMRMRLHTKKINETFVIISIYVGIYIIYMFLLRYIISCADKKLITLSNNIPIVPCTSI